MKLAINGRFLTQRVTGVQRYALEVTRALDELLASGHPALGDLEPVVLAPPGERQALELSHIPLRQVGRLRGHLWEQLELPLHAGSATLLSLCNTGPLAKAEQLAVIHDAAVFAMPQTFSRTFRTWYRALLPALARRARTLVTVSEFSRAELERYCRIPPGRLRVVHEGYEHMLRLEADASVLARHGLGGRPYALAVSSLNPSKNFGALLRATEHLGDTGFDVVIAGGVNSAVFGGTQTQSERVRHLGYVSDGELKALYEHATCFVHPALYEGFGLTPLEAMSVGCPVLASDIPVLREVLGDAALYADPRDPAALAHGIRRLMTDAALRARLRERGQERLHRYSWTATALGLLGALERRP